MNLWKSACAVVLSAGIACSAHAATYSVNGVMTGVDAGNFPAWYGIASYDISFNPTNPAFSGLWNIDLSAPTLSGVADFESYQAITDATIAVIDPSTGNNFHVGRILTRPHDVQTIDGTNAEYSYDSVTRTLTVKQPVITLTGTSEDCVSTGMSCEGINDPFHTVSDIELVLIFDESLLSFTGTSTIFRTFDDGSFDNTHWSFSGTAVPVPAAAWMLGSGLIGLAGIARRKKQAA